MKLNLNRLYDAQNARRWAKKERLENWHYWFAWFPVQLDHNDFRWLEWVQRRMQKKEYFDFAFESRYWKEYRQGSSKFGDKKD